MSETLKRGEWEVVPVKVGVAEAVIAAHHYARRPGAYPAIGHHGLFRRGCRSVCHGVTWWAVPLRGVAGSVWPADPKAVLTLARLAVGDAPKNAATFLLMGSVRLLDAARWRCLVTYADEWRGHRGTIYRAANWEYLGATRPRPVWLTAAGGMVSMKCKDAAMTVGDMAATGHTLAGKFRRHKFRLVLPPPRAKPVRDLFTGGTGG